MVLDQESICFNCFREPIRKGSGKRAIFPLFPARLRLFEGGSRYASRRRRQHVTQRIAWRPERASTRCGDSNQRRTHPHAPRMCLGFAAAASAPLSPMQRLSLARALSHSLSLSLSRALSLSLCRARCLTFAQSLSRALSLCVAARCLLCVLSLSLSLFLSLSLLPLRLLTF